MAEFTPSAFVAILSTIFAAELTDKDALLILALATRKRALLVFLAGATAFLLTTAIIVSLGSLAVTVIPVFWIKLVGGLVMLGYGAWQVRGVVGMREVEKEERMLEHPTEGFRAFFLMVGALALLDLAGDATEVLTVVFVAQYSSAVLVFASTFAGLVGATAVETTIGNSLGRLLTPVRMKYLSMIIFLVLGSLILIFTLVTA
jgi:putative Ca2+/H+ antiporter (TMEM165/GDT1 family)